MNHPILADGLVSKDGRSLAYADNVHLFRWPGALVYGATRPVATAEQEVFEAWKKWGRERFYSGATHAPYVDRSGPLDPDRPAPELSPRQLREQYLKPGQISKPGPEIGPNNPQFARGNEALAFEARRNRDRWMAQGRDIENPVLARLGVTTLAGDWPGGSPDAKFNEGAQWVLDALARDFFDGPIIPPLLLNEAGPGQCGALLASYLNSPHAAEIVRRFQSSIWGSLARRIDEKITLVEQELTTWARAGQLPVSRPEGGIDEALTLANAITATTGIYHLANLGRALVDFRRSGEAAIAGVLEALPRQQ